MRNTLTRFTHLFLVIMLMTGLMAGAVACSQPSSDEITRSTPILTVTKDSESKNFTMEDLKAMPVTEWTGCLRKENGPIEGPFRMKGVTILNLCYAAGGMNTTQAAEAIAPDGFVELPCKRIMESDFKTYDAATGESCPHGNLVVLLAYEQDGQPLDRDSGPLRVVILGGENVATEGFLWMKKISKVDIHEWVDYYEGDTI